MATDSEIKLWLNTVLSSRKFDDFSFEVVGRSEKGSGYASDVIFVHVIGIRNDTKEELDVVLKCAKRNATLRATAPMKEAFYNEIAFFDKILPALVQFQKQKGLSELISDSVPRYIGSYVDDSMEVIALENLKKIGFDLNDSHKSLTLSHLDLVVRIYANFHATSIAFQDQNREEFEKLTSLIVDNLFAKFLIECNMLPLLKSDIQDVYECLKNKGVDEKTLNQFKNLENNPEYILSDLFKERKVTSLVHGDSWNNNFMFRINKSDNKPTKATIIDWQIIGLSSPVRDLSYFLLSNSEEVFDNLDAILTNYYEIFAGFMRQLGSDPDKLYPRQVFDEEWKKFAKFGVLMGPMVIKVCTSKKEEICDIDEALEKGDDMMNAFKRDIKNNPEFIRRAKVLLEYVAKSGLLDN